MHILIVPISAIGHGLHSANQYYDTIIIVSDNHNCEIWDTNFLPV